MRELWGTLSIRKRKTTDQIGKSLCLNKEKVEDHIQEQQAYKMLWAQDGRKKHKAQNYYRATYQAMKKKKVETENTRSVTTMYSESQTLVLQKIVEFRQLEMAYS